METQRTITRTLKQTQSRQCNHNVGEGHITNAAVEVASGGGFGVIAHATRVWTLHQPGGLKSDHPWSGLFGIFYYTLNVFISKDASKVALIDKMGH